MSSLVFGADAAAGGVQPAHADAAEPGIAEAGGEGA
jgi:hypothetical protein